MLTFLIRYSSLNCLALSLYLKCQVEENESLDSFTYSVCRLYFCKVINGVMDHIYGFLLKWLCLKSEFSRHTWSATPPGDLHCVGMQQ